MIKGWRLNPYWVHVMMLREQQREMRRMYNMHGPHGNTDNLMYSEAPKPPEWVKDMK